ncbi:MAG: putative Ser/Thr protein kinase, partial [Bradymonadia bacterium]
MAMGPLNNILEQGRCPSCEVEGEVGAPCEQPRCAQYGYHVIPVDAFADRLGRGGLPDPHLGLDFGGFLTTGALGEGGVGKVYRARQRSTGMPAALKILKSSNSIFRTRFVQEAKVLAGLSHPNIVGLRDFGVQRDQMYLVMEFIEGETLTAFLASDPPLADLLPLFEQLLAALAYAHRRDIVHRDIKPDNIMLQLVGGQRFVRLVDFGLAKDIIDSDATSMLGGTKRYMAPEQFTRMQIGPWTDLYAVGCMAFRALTGREPYSELSATLRDQCKMSKPNYDVTAAIAGQESAAVLAFLHAALAHPVEARIRDAATFETAMRTAFAAKAGAPDTPLPMPDPAPAAAPVSQRAHVWVWVGLLLVAVGAGVCIWAPWADDAGVGPSSSAPATAAPATAAPATATAAPTTAAPTT